MSNLWRFQGYSPEHSKPSMSGSDSADFQASLKTLGKVFFVTGRVVFSRKSLTAFFQDVLRFLKTVWSSGCRRWLGSWYMMILCSCARSCTFNVRTAACLSMNKRRGFCRWLVCFTKQSSNHCLKISEPIVPLSV